MVIRIEINPIQPQPMHYISDVYRIASSEKKTLFHIINSPV